MRIFDILLLASIFPAVALAQPPYGNTTAAADTTRTTLTSLPSTAVTTTKPTPTPPSTSLVPRPSPAPTTTRSPQELESLVVGGLVDVPSIASFVELVRDQPSIFSVLDPRWDYDVLAPGGSAGGLSGDAGDGSVNPQLALAFVERKPGDPGLGETKRTLETALRDPKYVNLGKDEAAKLVSIPDGPNITILAGMGKSVTFSGNGERYGAGAVHVGDGYFTLPEDLSTTLLGTNGSAFAKFLADSGQLESLTSFPHVTIFALTDEAVAAAGSRLNKSSLDYLVIKDISGYTPDFLHGSTMTTKGGGTVMITIVDGVYYANGVKFAAADRIMKNGVVHYVTDILPYNLAGRPSISPFVTILAVAVALARLA